MKSFLERRRIGAAGLVALGAFAAPGIAKATDCDTLPSPVYLYGGNSPGPLIAKVGAALSQATPPVSVVYASPGACLGVDAIVGTSPTFTGTATYYDNTGAAQTCDLPITGATVQIGVGNNFPESCPEITGALPADFGDYLGPVLGIDFVVPKASQETSISAEAGYYVLGLGPTSGAMPWVDSTFVFTRSNTSAVSLLVGIAIKVPVSQFLGTEESSSSTMITAVGTSTNAEATLGMLSDDYLNTNGSTLSPLAYQHYGQDCGYYPSSDATKLDRQNIRDGHYALWGYTHFYAHKNSAGDPSDPAAKSLIDIFLGTKTIQGFDTTTAVIQAGAIPLCAMEVSRTEDIGPLKAYADPAPCDCLFDKTATGSTSCQSCKKNSECPAGANNCRYGYCEVN